MEWELNIVSDKITYGGIKFTPIRTVGEQALDLNHYGYTDPRDGKYKVCSADQYDSIAEQIAKKCLPMGIDDTLIEIEATEVRE
ncbi:MAG: hypothetical protein AAGD25_06690 [Cyanobacteria bacterium P01_F01_bin.150]